MKNSIVLTVFALLLLAVSSCKEEEKDTICEPGGVVHEFTDFVAGTYHYDLAENAYHILYSVPGTIDSVYDGYLCHELITGFDLTDGLAIQFTGKFSELPSSLPLEPRLGGQEIFHLEVTGIKLDN